MRKHAENLCQPPSKADGEKSFLSAKSVVRTETTKRHARRAAYADCRRRLPQTDSHQHRTEAVNQAATFRAEGCHKQDTLRLSR